MIKERHKHYIKILIIYTIVIAILIRTLPYTSRYFDNAVPCVSDFFLFFYDFPNNIFLCNLELVVAAFMIISIIRYEMSDFRVVLYSSMSLNITGTEAVRIFLQTKLELDFNMPLVIILCFVCLVTMTGISLLLAYISNAVFGFVVNLFFFIVSICSMKWFFFYNYFMTIRIPHVYNRWPYGLCLMLAINILLVAAGIIYSKKKDFI